MIPKPIIILVFVVAMGIAGSLSLHHAGVDSSYAKAESLRIDPDDAELVAVGKTIYAEHCASCHGAALEGQPAWRQRNADGRLPAPPHDASGHTWHHPDSVLFQLTKYGPAKLIGGGYESDMSGYEGVLSDAEIVAVLAYIKSEWPEAVRRRHDRINEMSETR